MGECAYINTVQPILRLVLLRYGRIETLSGFSNGVFLILISIFIVFEAIERL